MKHNPQQLAGYLRATADLYQTHARSALEWLALDWTQGRAANYEARVTGSLTSDPTSNAALAELDRLEREARRHATPGPSNLPLHPRSVLHRWVLAVGYIGRPVPDSLRTYARTLDGLHDPNQDTCNRLHQSAKTITDIIHLCRPINHEAAAKLLEDEQRATLASGYCQACESPFGPTSDGGEVKQKAGLCWPGCYDIERRHVAAGRFVDRATFCVGIKAGVTRGEIVREASPLYRTAVPMLHEGEVA